MVTKNLDSKPSDAQHRGHTVGWAAPEVMEKGIYSKEADMFSFAMVMIEVLLPQFTLDRNPHAMPLCIVSDCCLGSTQVFTGVIPFRDDSYWMVPWSIIQGTRPDRPTHPSFTGNLWSLMQRCWDQNPDSRPDASEALNILLTPSVSSNYNNDAQFNWRLLPSVRSQPGSSSSLEPLLQANGSP